MSTLRSATLWPCTALALLTTLAPPAVAAPRLPADEAQVLETVPARVADPRARELQALRTAWRANPSDAGLAVQLAQRYFDQAAA